MIFNRDQNNYLVNSDNPNLKRDPSSLALINKNKQLLDQHRARKRMANEIKELKEKIESIEAKLDSIVEKLER